MATEYVDLSKPHLYIFPAQIDDGGFIPSFYMTFQRDVRGLFPKYLFPGVGLIEDFEMWVEKAAESSTRFYGLGDDYKRIRLYQDNHTLADLDGVSMTLL
jgi:hypothetical protein